MKLKANKFVIWTPFSLLTWKKISKVKLIEFSFGLKTKIDDRCQIYELILAPERLKVGRYSSIKLTLENSRLINNCFFVKLFCIKGLRIVNKNNVCWAKPIKCFLLRILAWGVIFWVRPDNWLVCLTWHKVYTHIMVSILVGVAP